MADKCWSDYQTEARWHSCMRLSLNSVDLPATELRHHTTITFTCNIYRGWSRSKPMRPHQIMMLNTLSDWLDLAYSALIQVNALARFRHHSCLLWAATSASSQVRLIFWDSSPPPVCSRSTWFCPCLNTFSTITFWETPAHVYLVSKAVSWMTFSPIFLYILMILCD